MTALDETPTVIRQCPVCNQLAPVTKGIVRGHRDTANHRCYMVGRVAPYEWESNLDR